MRVRRLRSRRRRKFVREDMPTPSHGEVDTDGEDMIEAWEAGGDNGEQQK